MKCAYWQYRFQKDLRDLLNHCTATTGKTYRERFKINLKWIYRKLQVEPGFRLLTLVEVRRAMHSCLPLNGKAKLTHFLFFRKLLLLFLERGGVNSFHGGENCCMFGLKLEVVQLS